MSVLASMELERISLTCATWALAAGALLLCRKQSPLHAMVLAVLTSTLVATFYPVLSLFIAPATWRNVSQLSRELIVATQLEYSAWMAGLLAACAVAAQLRWLHDERRVTAPRSAPGALRRDFTIAWGLMPAGAALYALYVRSVGLAALTSRYDYAEKYLLSTGLGPLQFGLSMMIAACLWAEASELASRDKWLFRIVGAAIIVWAVAFISVRTYALLLALGYAAILCRRRKIELRRVRVSLIAALMLGYFGLESFSLFRDLYRDDFRQALDDLAEQGEGALASVVGGSELTHPFVTAAEVLHDRMPAELGGASLRDAVAALTPLAINPDRPLTLSEQFVRTNYADLASRGGGTAFSLVAEAWLDFGSLVGPFTFGAAFGLLLLALERRCRARPDGLLARVAPFFLFFVAVHHRNETATLLKQVFMLLLAVVPLWIVADAIRLSLARRPRLLAREGA